MSVSPITGGDNFNRLISAIKCLPGLSFEIDKYVFRETIGDCVLHPTFTHSFEHRLIFLA